MPIYDFKCYTCMATRTATISIEDKDYKAICKCGQPMTKIYYSPPIIFKGNGWATKDK